MHQHVSPCTSFKVLSHLAHTPHNCTRPHHIVQTQLACMSFDGYVSLLVHLLVALEHTSNPLFPSNWKSPELGTAGSAARQMWPSATLTEARDSTGGTTTRGCIESTHPSTGRHGAGEEMCRRRVWGEGKEKGQIPSNVPTVSRGTRAPLSA